MDSYNIENYEGRLSLFFKNLIEVEDKILYDYLSKSCVENLKDTIFIVFYLRDPRGGKGQKLIGRKCMLWLFINYPDEFEKVIKYIPEYGRWDDLLYFFPSVLKVSDFRNFKENISEGEIREIVKSQKKVVNIMISQLKEDLGNMFKGKPCSLCAKWTPTEGDSLDRETNVFKELCDGMGISAKNFRKTFNTPLREYLQIVEKYMCNDKWSDIDFSKVPAVAMKKLKNAFERRDPERFKEWKKSFKRINYLPHEIVKEIRINNRSNDILESSWKDVMNECKKSLVLKQSVAIIDTFNSVEVQNQEYLDVVISTALIISNVCEGLFHGNLITFSSTPKFEVIPDCGLYERINKIKSMVSENSVNIEASLELILKKVMETKGVPPKKVFIISYLEKRETNFDLKKIKALYKSSGFELPQIIFWNVNERHSVCKDVDKLVINGFSSVILNSIMNIEDLSCVSIMNNIMKSDRYKKLTGDPYFVEDCGDMEILNVPVEEEMSIENKSYCSVM